MRVINKVLSTNQATNVSSNSQYQPLRSIYTYAIQAIITGTPTGSIKLQASADPETNDTQYNTSASLPPSVAPVNWVDITGSTFAVSTLNGSVMWNVDFVGYNYVRVSYTDTSSGASTATMTITFNGKGV